MSNSTTRPHRALATIVLLLGAAGAFLGSSAAFTAKATNPNNTFTSGSLSMSNSQEDTAILTAGNLRPSGSTRGVVDIENTGTVTGTMKLSRTELSDSDPLNPLSAQLHLVVRDCGNFSAGAPVCQAQDPAVYTGPLAAMTQPSELGAYIPGERHRFEFTITLSAAAGNAYQGDSSTANFRWDAYQ